MASAPDMIQFLNPFMKTILKSPFHRIVSWQFMIITFNGIKSGKEYSTPVSYFMEGETVLCFTRSKWWRNLVSGVEVKLRLQGQDRTGIAEPVLDDLDQVAAILTRFLTEKPAIAGFYNVKLDSDGQLNKDEILKAAAEEVMVRISLN
jgi:hypothetical protein